MLAKVGSFKACRLKFELEQEEDDDDDEDEEGAIRIQREFGQTFKWTGETKAFRAM